MKAIFYGLFVEEKTENDLEFASAGADGLIKT